MHRALQEWPQFEFSALLNRSSQQILLVIAEPGNKLPVVLNLRPKSTITVDTPDTMERVDRFLASRGQWLEWPL